MPHRAQEEGAAWDGRREVARAGHRSGCRHGRVPSTCNVPTRALGEYVSEATFIRLAMVAGLATIWLRSRRLQSAFRRGRR